ncbi:MAG: insulinase family protein, partial [Myxococcota bacterium]
VPDRSGPPAVVPPTLMDLPEPEVHELGPNVTAWFVRVPGVRKVAVHVVMRKGHVELAGMPTQVSRALGATADAAGGGLSSAELSAERDLNELDLWTNIRMHEVELTVSVPREGLGHALELAPLVLRDPGFPKKDVARWVQDQELYFTVNGPSSQQNVSSAAMAFAWFPADHPYGVRPDLDQLRAVKPRALRATWDQWIHSAPIQVVVVGDVAWAEVEPQVRAITEGLGGEGPPGAALAVPTPVSQVVAVDMPGQEQVSIALRMEGPRFGPEYPAMAAANFVLGGTFLSRLNKNLREEKGYTYGANSGYRCDPAAGSITVGVDVKPENVAATIREINAELQRMIDEDVTQDELDSARRSLAADWNRTFENADRAASLYRRSLSTRSPVEGLRAMVPADTIGAEQIRATAARWYDAGHPRVWVVVGARSAIEAQLAEVGLTPRWTDPQSAILGTF